MPDILLSNDDLTVLGSPEVVELLVDIGPQGQRGSQVYFGIGNPNDPGVLINQEIELNDLYINAAPGLDYAYLYQYQSKPGGNSWVKIIKMNPPLYSKINEVDFDNGYAELKIDISNIATASNTPFTAENFNLQYQIANNNGNPVACSMVGPSLVNLGSQVLFPLNGVEFDGSDWIPLDGTYPIHTLISVMPTEPWYNYERW